MSILTIHPHGDGCWPDLIIDSTLVGKVAALARLPMGMVSGRSSVSMRIELPNGKVVIAEVSLAQLTQAVELFNKLDEHEGIKQ